MSASTLDFELSQEQIRQYHEDGYLLIRNHFTAGEVAEIIRETEALDAAGGKPGLYEPNRENPSEQLARYPRIMFPNRSEAWAKHYMLHPKTQVVLRALMETEPLAAQSMFYWKPPGGRGQAFHQDDFYLATQNGNCVACWVAIDRCDEDNGAMVGVLGSHRSEIVCPDIADEKISFTRELVKPPPGSKTLLMKMEPGDAFFFNGRFIHGSGPNRSKDRFRRAFICHYIPDTATAMSANYLPVWHFNGDPENFQAFQGGGPCGNEWAGAVH
ncbi:phytanoyl-CoA dioxygenase family protein [Oscillatoria amoena NRMC-F 0135]|nr:phytanoyl-CoA dioxygenase family protein [Oscillatoria laete-virens]MDL5048664.1 phytanoyl-CoA dioxygenase family protein [Oscillatoria amoena NRMC-F 0135]MDL5053243.1 phytanoyl-CoA dioxygenase family protein [Oscillatoria laete-virens NRMC-F 0139]